MISKKELLLRICQLESEVDFLQIRLEELESKKGKKNGK